MQPMLIAEILISVALFGVIIHAYLSDAPQARATSHAPERRLRMSPARGCYFGARIQSSRSSGSFFGDALTQLLSLFTSPLPLYFAYAG